MSPSAESDGTVAKSATLSEKHYRLMTFLEQRYLTTGMIPTSEVCVESGVCAASFYLNAFKSTKFVDALAARGISIRGIGKDQDHGILTEEQLVAANVMLDLRDNRSQRKKLGDLNIPTARWEGWLRDTAFQNYLRQRAENLLGDNLHESHLALVDRVRSGDVSAIKYFNEITGRFVPRSDEKVDVNAILMQVLEVLQKHVKDPDTLVAVAEDLLALSTSTAMKENVPVRAPMKRLAAIEVGDSIL